MDSYFDIIDSSFSRNLYKSATEAQNRIEELTEIKGNLTQIRSFIKEKLVYRFLKVGSVPDNDKDDDNIKEFDREKSKKTLVPFWIKLEREKR